jgi:hypothetical protein
MSNFDGAYGKLMPFVLTLGRRSSSSLSIFPWKSCGNSS